MTRTSAPEATGRFADLGLAPPLVSVLDELGYEEPTPIQRDAIPPLLAGRDLVGQAATGTGKTAAFALPLLQRSFGDGRKGEGPALLVLVPTRELAMQVAEAIHRYGRKLGVRVLPVYGGQSLGLQLQALRRGVDVVVATPGRALDHLRRGTLALGRVRAVVLDEADEMLDMCRQLRRAPAPESYVHRIGRTGRAGREGVAITLAEPRERPLLRNIEKLTRRPLEMATVPTVADLRARRLEVTRASLREAVVAGGNEGFRVVVESLAEEFDVLDIAAAAVRVAFEANERPEGAPSVAAETATPPGTARAAGDFTRFYRYRPPARDGRAAPRSAPRPTSTRRRTSSPARPRR